MLSLQFLHVKKNDRGTLMPLSIWLKECLKPPTLPRKSHAQQQKHDPHTLSAILPTFWQALKAVSNLLFDFHWISFSLHIRGCSLYYSWPYHPRMICFIDGPCAAYVQFSMIQSDTVLVSHVCPRIADPPHARYGVLVLGWTNLVASGSLQ